MVPQPALAVGSFLGVKELRPIREHDAITPVEPAGEEGRGGRHSVVGLLDHIVSGWFDDIRRERQAYREGREDRGGKGYLLELHDIPPSHISVAPMHLLRAIVSPCGASVRVFGDQACGSWGISGYRIFTALFLYRVPASFGAA